MMRNYFAIAVPLVVTSTASAQITMKLPFDSGQWWGPASYTDHSAWNDHLNNAIDFWFITNQTDSQSGSCPFWAQALGQTAGKSVRAAHGGTIRRKQYDAGGYGYYVVIRSGENGDYLTLYAHLSNYDDCPAVGQTVEAGAKIGVVGSTGSTGDPPAAHLHFELLKENSVGGRTNGLWTSQSLPGRVFDGQALTEFSCTDPGYTIRKQAKSLKAAGVPDITPPSVSFSNAYQYRWFRQGFDYTVEWSVADSGSGVHGFYQKWSTNPNDPGTDGGYAQSSSGWLNIGWAGSSGQWYAIVRARDNAGNEQTYRSEWVGFDNVLPGATRTGGINPTTWYRGSQTVTYTGTDAHSGFRDSQCWWEGQSTQGWNSTNPRQVIVPTASGKYRLHVEVADNAWTDPGNATSNSSGDLFLGEFWIDNTNPTTPTIALTPSSPNGLNGWYITRPTANFSATDPGPFSSGAPTTFYSVNGGTYVQGSSLLVADGITSVLTSYARDPVQNDSAISAPTTVKVDTTPPNNPTLEDEGIKRPDGTLLQISITGGGDPESGADVVEYLVSDSANPNDPLPAWGIGPKQAPFTGKRFAIEGLNIPDGEQVFVLARQRNNAGLWSQWGASDGILIDRSAFPENLTAFLFSGGTSEGTQDDWTLEGSLGETIVFGNDSPIITRGFWAMALPFLVHPDAVTVISGEEFQGNLDSLLSSDDDRYLAFNDPTSLATVIEQLLYMPISDGTKLAIRYESAVARPGLAENLQCFNTVTTTWVVLSGRVAPTADSVANWSVATGIAPYLSESNQLKVRFFWHPINDEDPAQDGWLCSLDLTECEITP